MSRQGTSAPLDLSAAAGRAKGTALGFAAGFGALFRGARFAYRDHRELARFYLPPMAFSLILLIGGWIAFAYKVDDLLAWMWPEPKPDPDAWWAFLAGVLSFLWGFVAVLMWIILALIALIAIISLFSLFAAPFNDLLSERTEGILGTWEPRKFSWRFLAQDLWQTVLLEFRRLMIKVVWLLPLFLVSLLVPFVGQALYLVVGGYILAKLLGMDYIDWCMARRGWKWKDRFAFAREHRWAVVGLGTAVLLVSMIPLGFVAAWPAAVTGGTLLFTSVYADQERRG